ncbi:hypothetical protein B0H15DRAFT_819808 [Mycena belliarum]|uniref:Uncharacterized protein n=1 Tax=Mycena belliarum TaxID=1033014 RepID=A0AAD6UCR1_9AGAR|nr:hypothetical protein B0H15DRAFT_819808 [Mycena belliae]
MLDHYYTPRDAAPGPDPRTLLPRMTMDFDRGPFDSDGPTNTGASGKTLPPRGAVVDLRTLDLELVFDCDSGSESGSDDGYVSTLQRLQRTLPSSPPAPRKIAGARRVARAVSAPQTVLMPDVEATAAGAGPRARIHTPEGEVFQSITAIPGLECTSFEELRLETYMQSLVATGTARPQPAFAPALVIPPAFSSPFVDWDRDAGGRDVDMPPAPPIHPQPVSRTASFPPTNPHHWPLYN